MLFLVLCRGPTTREGESVLFGPLSSFRHASIWDFPKIRGTLFWGPYSKDPTIQGTIPGSPIFGSPHLPHGLKPEAQMLKDWSFKSGHHEGLLWLWRARARQQYLVQIRLHIYIYIYIYPDMFCVYVSGVLQGIPETLNPKP